MVVLYGKEIRISDLTSMLFNILLCYMLRRMISVRELQTKITYLFNILLCYDARSQAENSVEYASTQPRNAHDTSADLPKPSFPSASWESGTSGHVSRTASSRLIPDVFIFLRKRQEREHFN